MSIWDKIEGVCAPLYDRWVPKKLDGNAILTAIAAALFFRIFLGKGSTTLFVLVGVLGMVIYRRRQIRIEENLLDVERKGEKLKKAMRNLHKPAPLASLPLSSSTPSSFSSSSSSPSCITGSTAVGEGKGKETGIEPEFWYENNTNARAKMRRRSGQTYTGERKLKERTLSRQEGRERGGGGGSGSIWRTVEGDMDGEREGSQDDGTKRLSDVD